MGMPFLFRVVISYLRSSVSYCSKDSFLEAYGPF